MDRTFMNAFIFVMFNCIACMLIGSTMSIAPDEVTIAQFWADWSYFIFGTFAIFNAAAILMVKFGYQDSIEQDC